MPPRKRKAPAATSSAISSAPVPSVDVSKMKFADLKVELQKRGLDTTGKKADLVQRLKDTMGDHDVSDAAGEPSAKKGKAETKEEKEEKEDPR